MRGRCEISVFFFFFQAEDGIRDIGVTGVQTCALSHSGATGMVSESALRPTADRALAKAGIEGGVRGSIGPAQEGWEDVDAWWREGDDSPIDTAVADDDPLRLMYTSGTESR